MQQYPHGDKLARRMENYREDKELIEQLMPHYLNFKKNCENISFDILDRTESVKELVNYADGYLKTFSGEEYKKIRNNSRSKIYPSLLEEFMYYLFRPLLKEPFVCGTGSVQIDIHLKPFVDIKNAQSYEECLCQETTMADFVIGIPMKSATNTIFIYPVVIIENKRYADKTMRGTIENTARKLKRFSPDCLFIVVVDILSGFFDKNYSPKNTVVDQIYGLREGNYLGNESLRKDIVLKLFYDVEQHLINIQSSPTIKERCERGYIC